MEEAFTKYCHITYAVPHQWRMTRDPGMIEGTGHPETE